MNSFLADLNSSLAKTNSFLADLSSILENSCSVFDKLNADFSKANPISVNRCFISTKIDAVTFSRIYFPDNQQPKIIGGQENATLSNK